MSSSNTPLFIEKSTTSPKLLIGLIDTFVFTGPHSVIGLIADSGVIGSISAGSNTFVENIFYCHYPPSLIQDGLLPVTSESICMKYWLTT